VQSLGELAAAHDASLEQLERILGETSAASDPGRLRELTKEFYGILYGHFGRFRSAPAFFQLSGQFLRELTGALDRYAVRQQGLSGCRLPDTALIALGPAGRGEFSPFCPLQLVLVHGDTGQAESETVSLYCRTLQEGFEACGLRIDREITPANPSWRGTVSEWDERLAHGLKQSRPMDSIELLRLADQDTLHSAAGLDDRFRQLAISRLRESPSAMGELVVRLLSLSNGLGIMGGWLLERKGPRRGLFRLFDHALLPLSVTVTALALISRVGAVSTPQRIRELLGGRVLNVELIERLMQSWHTLNELRLMRERELYPDWRGDNSLYLDVTVLDEEKKEALKEALETISTARRHVSVIHSAWESEQP
jgi:signal-transduction protein with cAMP-binding, CBS, and nucleotidyltransferase domain